MYLTSFAQQVDSRARRGSLRCAASLPVLGAGRPGVVAWERAGPCRRVALVGGGHGPLEQDAPYNDRCAAEACQGRAQGHQLPR